MTLRRSISMAIRSPMLEPNWLPNWVTLPELAAAAVIARASHTSWAMGFWQKTCLPFASAAIAMAACMWSGTVTLTESMRSPSLLEHFAPIGVGPRAGARLGGGSQDIGIHVAEGDDGRLGLAQGTSRGRRRPSCRPRRCTHVAACCWRPKHSRNARNR